MKRCICLLVLILGSSVSHADFTMTGWEPLFKGVEHATGNATPGGTETHVMVVQALRVDLTDPDITLFTDPKANNGAETAGYTTSGFLKTYGVQVAINGSFFDPCCSAPSGSPMFVTGLSMCTGVVVSAQESLTDSSVIMFTKDKVGSIVSDNFPPQGTNGIWNAVAGHYVILQNGVNLGFSTPEATTANPRTAVGLSQDGRYLIMMTIDGRLQPNDGAYDSETAAWLIRFGSYNGLQLDGGGSTAMVKASCDGSPIQVNVPNNCGPGCERVVANHLGVYAKPLPNFITDVQVLPGPTTATINWTTTSPADSQVNYGLTSAYGSSTPYDPTLVTTHTADLSGLTAGTTYYFQIVSSIGAEQHTLECTFSTTNVVLTLTPLVNLTNQVWSYTTNNLDGVGWQAKNYGEPGWLGSGRGNLYIEVNTAVPQRNTPLPGMSGALPPTYYFRSHFNFSGNPTGVTLTFSNYVDDAAVFYLNGAEIYRLRMADPPAVITYETYSTSGAPGPGTDATIPDLFTVSGSLVDNNLLTGDNVLAVEVHQIAFNSSDIVFGSALFYTPGPGGGPTNHPPTLTVPGTQTINELTTMTVTNSATDPDGNSLTFALVSPPSGMNINNATGVLTWTPSEIQGPSTNTIKVRVFDNGSPSMSATQSFTVIVNEVNSAPSLTVPTTQTINELATLTVTNTATDPDLPANTLTFGLVSGPSGVNLNTATGVITWTPTELQGPSSNNITVRVFDNGSPSLSATQTFVVLVNEVNNPPVLTVPATQTINELTTLTVTNTATDPDLPANVLTFALVSGPGGVNVDATTGVLTWTPNEAQGPSSNNITVRVLDNGSPSLSATQTFVVLVNEVNSAPSLTVPATQIINELTTLTVTNTATDPDLPANTLTFGLVSGPSGVNLNAATGVLTWTPDESQGPSSNNITVRVFDNGSPSLSATQTFVVLVNEVNSAPTLVVPPTQTINELTTLTVTNIATDSDIPANALTFALVSGPSGVNLDATTGVLTWTPNEAQGPSSNNIVVRVFDDGSPSLSTTQSFVVLVNEVNSAPSLTVPATQIINELTTLTVTNIATDSDIPANTLTFALVSGPSGINLDATTGVLTWTPTEAQGPSSNNIVVRVFDDGSPILSATQTFVVLVNEVNSAPVLTPIPDKTASEGTLLTFTATASDADLPANNLTFTLDAGTPAGASITSQGVFTWTPPTGSAPTNIVTVRVTDDGSPALSDSLSFKVIVVAVSAPRIIEISESPAGQIKLVWEAVAGKNYRVLFKDDLSDLVWSTLPGGDIPATGPTATASDPLHNPGQRFYQIQQL